MRSDVLVATFIAFVFLDKVQIVTTNDDGTLHLRRVHNSAKDTPTDGDVPSEGALLIDVSPIDCSYRCVVAHTDGFVKTEASCIILSEEAALEYLGLLMVRPLVLILSHLIRSLAQILGPLEGSPLAIWIWSERVSPVNLCGCAILRLVLRR